MDLGELQSVVEYFIVKVYQVYKKPGSRFVLDLTIACVRYSILAL
jgi:hypothetical protein